MSMLHFRKKFNFTAVLFLFIWVCSCAVNPVTGKRELMLLSDQEEIAMGQGYDPQVVQMYGVYDDPEISAFITDLGTRMAKVSHRPQLQYHFRLLDSPVVNAFAVPGGYVYITRGILAYLNSEAEFAGVLGHEIGHITARHSAKQVSQQQLAQLGMGVGIIATAELVSPEAAQVVGMGAQVGMGLLFLRFGRDHERQSDRLGVEYSTRVQYDAHEMANFFETLEQMSPPGQSQGLPGWFSTHPSPTERVGKIKALTDEWQQKLGTKNAKIGRESFLRMIDGLVYGDDPRQGFVENDMFYHPELKFQFPLPQGWQTVNTPTQVQIISSDQKAGIIFKIASGASPQQAAQTFISEAKATVLNSRNTRVNGNPARVVRSEISGQSGKTAVLSYFIQYGGNVYVFHGLSAPATMSAYEPLMISSMEGFRRLTDRSKLSVKPERIRIKTVPRQMTLQQAFQHFGLSQDRWEEAALLNGMKLSDTLQRGTLIKIVAR